jgi:hypothetical protein
MPKAEVRARTLLLKDTKKETDVAVLSGGDSERIANEFRDAGYNNIEVLELDILRISSNGRKH